MSKIALTPNASGSGTFTIAAPNSNTDRTLTLPDEAGTVLTSASDITQNSGPAFHAYASSNQTLTINTYTKIQFNVERFDTDSCYDNSTNYRFTPTVAGYYSISMAMKAQLSSTTTATTASIFKNGSVYANAEHGFASTGVWPNVVCTTLVYLNGSTDYIEGYAYASGATLTSYAVAQSIYLCGHLVRK